MDYVYQVIFQDEYNNLYLIGFYKNLDDCIPEINGYLGDDYKPLEKGDLAVYPGTMEMVFDRELYDKDECNSVYVRGFIFTEESLNENIGKFLTKKGE